MDLEAQIPHPENDRNAAAQRKETVLLTLTGVLLCTWFVVGILLYSPLFEPWSQENTGLLLMIFIWNALAIFAILMADDRSHQQRQAWHDEPIRLQSQQEQEQEISNSEHPRRSIPIRKNARSEKRLRKLGATESQILNMEEWQKLMHLKKIFTTTEAEENELCSICKEPYVEDGEEGCRRVRTICEHSMGELCLGTWMFEGGNWRCPVCRGNLLKRPRDSE